MTSAAGSSIRLAASAPNQRAREQDERGAERPQEVVVTDGCVRHHVDRAAIGDLVRDNLAVTRGYHEVGGDQPRAHCRGHRAEADRLRNPLRRADGECQPEGDDSSPSGGAILCAEPQSLPTGRVAACASSWFA